MIERLKTHTVYIGEIPVGSQFPVRIQSMTTTDTMDTIATVEQSIRLYEAGCDYVRITAPSKKEAENLRNIKNEIKLRAYNIPLIADIHYTPNAAEIAAKIVEKVRINPGNYADKKRFQFKEYTDSEYQAEIERIRDRFSPLVKICKKHGTAMRIGTNHGSLSDRILSRYGDTPEGMVESAYEFLRICEEYDYDQVVLSMKASNVRVMVQAYRLLVKKMKENGIFYPLHLGVTEAGNMEAGRIKSAMGIGALMAEGIGDTIRVSLTEEPEEEVPTARFLVNYYEKINPTSTIDEQAESKLARTDFHDLTKNAVRNIGADFPPVVLADLSENAVSHQKLTELGYLYSEELDKFHLKDRAADFIYLGENIPKIALPQSLAQIYDYKTWKSLESKNTSFPYFKNLTQWNEKESAHSVINFVEINSESNLDSISFSENLVIVLRLEPNKSVFDYRSKIVEIQEKSLKTPIILHFPVETLFTEEEYAYHLTVACQLSSILIDNLLQGLMIENYMEESNLAAFTMLQAARLRMSETEYIACPSCGRTLFDLQETTAKIKSHTAHLKGVKIGIMGCIVNGPGEMADADFGYVGSGKGKIDLYKGQDCVIKNIPEEKAVEELISLIKTYGKWKEPKVLN